MGLRKDRLADEIRDILGRCFQGGQMQDPRLENLTITSVKLTGDLQQATAYFRIMTADVDSEGAAPQQMILKANDGLNSASGFLRRRIAEGTLMRRVPSIKFIYDKSVEYGSHIEGLLAKIDR